MSEPASTPPSPTPLRQARLDQGLRLVDVAAKAGCAPSYVSTVERGGPASDAARDRIARAVGASLGSFW
jgi:transcriptional regulator with XRE-family HTH domain